MRPIEPATRLFHRMVDPPVRTNGLRRSDSIDFCVRDILTVGFEGDGAFTRLATRLGWRDSLPMKPGWLLAAAKTTGELAYREWAEGVAPTQACWWAWVAASSDWAEVCTAVATHGVTPTALCAMRLELLEACRISLSDAPQARVVSSWMSAHLGWPCVTPGVAAVMDGGACPDCTRALMCIDPRSRFSAGHPIGPVQHLLRKAFPRRCQIRELLRFVSAYWCKYTEVEWFLRCAVFCCLGGFYVHHKPSTAPPLEARQALYDVCFRNGPMSLAAWMCAPEGGNALHGMQCTLLLVLQDAVVATVFATPSQARVYHGFVDWAAFLSHVTSATTDAQRVFASTRILHAPAKQGDKRQIGQQPTTASPIFVPLNNEDCLVTWLRTNVVRGQADWDAAIRASGALLSATDVTPNPCKTGWGRNSCLYDFVCRMRRAGGEACVEVEQWARRGFGTHSERHAALTALGTSHPRALAILAVLVEVMRARGIVTLSPLPQLTHEKQLVAVRKRYSSCQVLPAHAGALVVCLFCATVKNPVVQNHVGGPQNAQDTNLRCQLSSGIGAGGVVYDDETCRIYCNAHARVGTGRRQTGTPCLLRTRLCALTPLWVGSVVGQVAAVDRTMFTLCCTCACPMKLSTPQRGGSFLLCEACAPPMVVACVSCGKLPGSGRPRTPANWSTEQRLVYGGTHTGPGNIKLGPLCGPCGRSVASKRRRCFDATHIICV